MSEWLPIESAPRGGDVLLSYWRDVPVFIAWFAARSEGEVRYAGIWPFRRIVSSSLDTPAEWRVVTFSPRHDSWVIAGNYAPFTPLGWMPLPDPPVQS